MFIDKVLICFDMYECNFVVRLGLLINFLYKVLVRNFLYICTVSQKNNFEISFCYVSGICASWGGTLPGPL
jgi:hypothetical protein